MVELAYREQFQLEQAVHAPVVLIKRYRVFQTCQNHLGNKIQNVG
jgi:hypothetical protein